MISSRAIMIGAALAVCLTCGLAQAQSGMYAAPDADGRWQIVERGSVPMWENDPRFKKDVFTFVRVNYGSGVGGRDFFRSATVTPREFTRRGLGLDTNLASTVNDGVIAQRGRRGGGRGGRGGGYGGGYGGRWATDYPEADLDFSYRLHQLTSMKVDPVPKVVRITDEELFDYPFLYMVEVGDGRIQLTNEEISLLRRYLENGGFLMVDDFWGDYAWEWFHGEIQRWFPGREPVELPIEHEIFHCVYNIKQKPQVPAINSVSPERVAQGITWEMNHGPGAETVHYKGIFDDKGRMMVLICHNTDLGDGWEREGYDEWYFHEFCENKSYPMGINIVTYAMTH